MLDNLDTLHSDLRVDNIERGGLHAFVRHYWSIADAASPFVDSWQIGAVCEFLQAWYRREFSKGVINIPPGCSKSTMASVHFPAFVWALDPAHKFFSVSFDRDLTLRDALKMRNIVSSSNYQLDFGHDRQLFGKPSKATVLDGDHSAIADIWTTAGGYRCSTSIDGKGMGRHFDSVVIDDPSKPQDVLGASDVAIKKAELWFNSTLPTRRANPKTFGIMLIMQRLKETDLAQVCLNQGYEHLCLPMQYCPKAIWIIGDWSAKLDPRKEEGELLNPERFDAATVIELTNSLADNASAQLQQNPIPRTGGLIEEDWLRWEWIDVPYHGLWVQEWDFSGKGETERHSAVHGALWCAASCDSVRELLNSVAARDRGEPPKFRTVEVPRHVRYHLVDEVWGIWDFPETQKRFIAAQSRPYWNLARVKRCEEKAAGIQLIQTLRSKVAGIVPTKPETDKIARFRPTVPPSAEAGLILLPPWKATVRTDCGAAAATAGTGPDEVRKELLGFPRAAKDDRADTTSSAVSYFTEKDGAWWETVREVAKMRGA